MSSTRGPEEGTAQQGPCSGSDFFVPMVKERAWGRSQGAGLSPGADYQELARVLAASAQPLRTRNDWLHNAMLRP